MVIYTGHLSYYPKITMIELSFLPLKLDINAVYLTVDDKIRIDISRYFHTTDIRMLTPFLLLV